MQNPGVKSRMTKPRKKLKTYTEVEQKTNLIKSLADKSKVIFTDMTYIPVKNRRVIWLTYLTQNPS